jgi:hypothetical protein
MHLRRRAFSLFFHISHARALLDAPARNRVERRRANSLPARRAETRVVPRAADRILDKETVDKRSAIMSTPRAKTENLIAASDKEYGFTPGVTEEHGPVGNTRNVNPLSQIRSDKFCILFVHVVLAGYFRLSSSECACRSIRDVSAFAR